MVKVILYFIYEYCAIVLAILCMDWFSARGLYRLQCLVFILLMYLLCVASSGGIERHLQVV